MIIAVRVFPKDKSASCHAVSFISIKGDLISEMDEYWADYGEVSEWRLSMKIGTSIKQIRFE